MDFLILVMTHQLPMLCLFSCGNLARLFWVGGGPTLFSDLGYFWSEKREETSIKTVPFFSYGCWSLYWSIWAPSSHYSITSLICASYSKLIKASALWTRSSCGWSLRFQSSYNVFQVTKFYFSDWIFEALILCSGLWIWNVLFLDFVLKFQNWHYKSWNLKVDIHNTNISVMILKFVFFGFFEIFLLLFLHFQFNCGLWINLFIWWFYCMLPSLIKNCIHQSRIINLWLLWWDVLCRVWSFISQSFYFLYDIIFFNQAGWWDNFSGKLKLLCWKS